MPRPLKSLLPATARQRWKSSSVHRPVAVVRGICEKYPRLDSAALVEKCVAAGVAKATATVAISRFKSEQK